uniref:Uncharacterized protein n=1 Tax=Solanum tuberosum TaxID=4113 RepID=M1DAN1_SOLTU
MTETNKEVERDFSLAALPTQLDEVTKKVMELDVQCKKKDRYIPPPELKGMVRTNIHLSPQKRVRGITINEWGSNTPKKGRKEPPPGDKGKGKSPVSDRMTNGSQAALSKLEDNQPLQSQMLCLNIRLEYRGFIDN